MAKQGQSGTGNSNSASYVDPSTNQTDGNNQQNSMPTYDQARQKTGEVIDQVQEKTGEVFDQLREQATSQLDAQKGRVAEGLGSVAQMVRMGEDQLRRNNQEAIANYTGKVANSMEQLSTFVRERDLGEMVQEVENFARREPALFLGGAFTLGLLASRFLKSSGPSQFNSTSANQSSTTLARRPGDTADNSTHAPLTPAPMDQAIATDNVGEGAFPAESSVGRHFGEARAAGEADDNDLTSAIDQQAGLSQAEAI